MSLIDFSSDNVVNNPYKEYTRGRKLFMKQPRLLLDQAKRRVTSIDSGYISFTKSNDMEPDATLRPFVWQTHDWAHAESQDPEWVYMVNRMDYVLDYAELAVDKIVRHAQDLAPLAEVSEFQKLSAIMQAWVASHPTIEEGPDTRTLDTAMRIANWAMSLDACLSCYLFESHKKPVYTKERATLSAAVPPEIIESIRAQISYLRAHFLPRYETSNWGLIIASGIGIAESFLNYWGFDAHPELEDEQTHELSSRLTLKRLLQLFMQQFDDYGVNWEQSTLYHMDALKWFSFALYYLGMSIDVVGLPPQVYSRIHNAIAFGIALHAPDNLTLAWGDGDRSSYFSDLLFEALLFKFDDLAIQIFKRDENCPLPQLWPILGARIQPDFEGILDARDTFEFSDLDDEETIETTNNLLDLKLHETGTVISVPLSYKEIRDRVLHAGLSYPSKLNVADLTSGIYIHQTDHTHLMFTNASLGSGHGHADNLALTYSIEDFRILIDAGRYTYMNTDDRLALKSRAAHNVPLDSAGTACSPTESWDWSGFLQPLSHLYTGDKNTAYFEGSVLEQDPMRVITRQATLIDEGEVLLVRDRLQSDQEQIELSQNWTIDPDMDVLKLDDTTAQLTHGPFTVTFKTTGTIALVDTEVSLSYNKKATTHRIIVKGTGHEIVSAFVLGNVKQFTISAPQRLGSSPALTRSDGVDILIKNDARVIELMMLNHSIYTGSKALYLPAFSFTTTSKVSEKIFNIGSESRKYYKEHYKDFDICDKDHTVRLVSNAQVMYGIKNLEPHVDNKAEFTFGVLKR